MTEHVRTLNPGRAVHVRVPASSANLGPGFDTLGLAVSLYDDVDVEVTKAGLEVIVTGSGEGKVPLDERHLVVRAVKSGLAAAGCEAPGLKIVCHNRIPQSRGLGSSASAVVAGVAAANGLAGFPLTDADVIQLASAFEGHPDNAAASVLGGAVVAWTELPGEGSKDPLYKAVRIPVHQSIVATALVPKFRASTAAVRKVLPSDVPHVDARFNVSRCAVMTVALGTNPELLWEGTRDKLHQPYRADFLPVTAEWITRLRNRGWPAFLSGAGPTVMVLSTKPVDPTVLGDARSAGFDVLKLQPAGPVKVTVTAE